MAKRKRQAPPAADPATETKSSKKQKSTEAAKPSRSEPTSSSTEAIRVVAGSYDGTLHGLTVTIGPKGKAKKPQAEFTDTFLLQSHSRSVRCLAVSPPSAATPGRMQNVLLASGSADSKISLYSLSAHPPKEQPHDPLRHMGKRPIVEDPHNRPLVNLEHHESAVTALHFPSRSKLMSSSEDSTIVVTRTRDWATLGSIKAPVAKAVGRPSGDTAAHDGTPQGVNDFAVHPSMMLMMSVSKGERKVRPWNLMTGRRAKALNYERELLQQVGEGRHSSGEGKKLVWGNVDDEDEFAVGFDRDVVVFSTAGEPKCRVMPTTKTKIHQVSYVTLGTDSDESRTTLLAASTEDGRIVFTSTRDEHVSKIADAKEGMAPGVARTAAYVGGKAGGVTGRIKDFAVVPSASDTNTAYVIGGGSDGVIRVWTVDVGELQGACEKPSERAIGTLIGTCETENRVTCMSAFLMIPRPEGVESDEELDELDLLEGDEPSGSDDSEDDEE